MRGASEGPEYPLTSLEAEQIYSLNDFELQEIKKYNKEIYYAGQNCKNKIRGHPIKMQ